MNWSDPNFDVIGDIKNFMQQCKEQYQRMLNEGDHMHEQLINETKSLIEETSPKEKKRKRVSDFVSNDVNPSSLHLLAGLNQLSKHIYAGTVSGAEKEKRRAKNKRARAARRKSR